MGDFIKDSTTSDILVRLNKRFDPDELPEMVALQKEFKVFSAEHSLQQSFALLGIVPADWSERQRWYRFLDHLKTYKSDLPKVSGHDRVIKAIKDNLEADKSLPMSIVCHSAADDPNVKASTGNPFVFTSGTYAIVSIPTTPARQARRQPVDAAKARPAKKSKK